MAALDPLIDDVLVDLGFRNGSLRQLARETLIEAGLTNPRKQRIASRKIEAVRDVLAARFRVICPRPACRAAVAGRPMVEAAVAAVAALLRRGMRRQRAARYSSSRISFTRWKPSDS